MRDPVVASDGRSYERLELEAFVRENNNVSPHGSLRARVSGVVKFYNPHSSFGYIVQDDGSDDVYVHAKALGAVPGGVLGAGDKVEYRVAVFNERPRAKDVRVLERA